MAKELQTIKASEFFKMIDNDSIQETYLHIRENNIKLKPSTKFSVLVNDEPFPPKDFIRIIAKLKGYKIEEDSFYGGKANKPFEKLKYLIINNEEYPFFNISLLESLIYKYQKAIEKTDWLRVDESYKFHFIKWVEENIDFVKDSNQEIKRKVEESQQNTYSPNSNIKGVNFIQTITRYQDDYLTIEDIDKLKKIVFNNAELNKENLTLSFGSFPKTSAFLCLFAPEKFMAYDGESLPAYEFFSKGLNNGNKAPKRNFKAFKFYQIFYKKIKKHLKENSLNTAAFKSILKVETLTELHWNFITQDFLLYITRQIMNAKIPAYYCVGFHFYGETPTNQLPRFIENNFWENGYDDKFVKVVNGVPIGSLIAAKTSYTMNENDKTISVLEVHCIGEVIENKKDGKHLKVNWQKDFKSFVLKRKGGYRSTIGRVQNQSNINAIFYNKDLIEDIIEDEEQNEETPLFSLNQILYGPPGTGKTYKTKELAVNICFGEKEREREEILDLYEELQKKNQILFTTFHQSISYEDFIEGIKPVLDDDEGELNYEIQNGLFKNICTKALSEYYKSELSNKNNEGFQKLSLFEDAWNNLIKESESKLEQSKNFTVNTLTKKKIKIISISDKGNFIIKPENSSDTDREYTISYKRAKKLFEAFPDLTVIKNIDKEFRQVIGGSNSTAYWSVINYMNNWIDNTKNISTNTKETININEDIIKFNNEIVKRNKKNSINQYVLIIDEINRGNISSIFGELITLIEDDKRLGNKEAILVNLPYSKKVKFGVPPNLHIIGTMNTADRSVEALDTALRRRFSFKEVEPNSNTLIEAHKNDGVIIHNGINIDLSTLLNTINDRIELLIDKDHKIGHSYFIKVLDFNNLVITFKDKVIPLLEEYFYGDFGKIGLVLGSKFIVELPNDKKVDFSSNFEYNDASMLKEKSIYKFSDDSIWDAETFTSIYTNKNISIE